MARPVKCQGCGSTHVQGSRHKTRRRAGKSEGYVICQQCRRGWWSSAWQRVVEFDDPPAPLVWPKPRRPRRKVAQ